jgi:hypothetical protein
MHVRSSGGSAASIASFACSAPYERGGFTSDPRKQVITSLANTNALTSPLFRNTTSTTPRKLPPSAC